jgi:hypothetical protein
MPSIDPITNFGKVQTLGGHTAVETSIPLQVGDGAKLPLTADGDFNLVWFNSTDYTDPADDPNVEIVRCTANGSDTLTVTRAQEGTSATVKNLTGKAYHLVLSPTKRTYDQAMLPYKRVYDVTDPAYGAVGDNVTDDTVAIQAAIDAAVPGGIVFFPTGTYLTSATLEISSNISLLGVGVGRSLIYNNVSGGTCIAQKSPGTRVYNVRIENLNIQSTNSDGTYGLDLEDFTGARIVNVTVGAYTHGFYLHTGEVTGCLYNYFVGCNTINLSGTTGFLVRGIAANSNTWLHCKAGGQTVGLDLEDGNSNLIIGSAFEQCTTGVKLHATSALVTSHNSIVQCRFENDTTAIDLDNTTFPPVDTYIFAGHYATSNGTQITDNGTRTTYSGSRLGSRFESVTDSFTVADALTAESTLTVDGASTLTGAVTAESSLQVGTDAKVATISDILYHSETWDPPSLSNTDSDDADFTVTGVALGDIVVGVSHTTHVDEEVFMDAKVTATNTITLSRYNRSSFARDYASGTLAFVIFKVS